MFETLKKLSMLDLFKRSVTYKKVSSVQWITRATVLGFTFIQWVMLWLTNETGQVPLPISFLCLYYCMNHIFH